MYYSWMGSWAEDVVQQRFPQKKQGEYLAALMGAMWFLFVLIGSRSYSDFVYYLGMIIIMGGVLLCSRENRRGDNKDFIPRFICLGYGLLFPMLACAALPASILAYVAEDQWGYSLTMYLIPIVLCIYFWRLHRWIGVVARGEVKRRVISPESDNVLDEKDTSH